MQAPSGAGVGCRHWQYPGAMQEGAGQRLRKRSEASLSPARRPEGVAWHPLLQRICRARLWSCSALPRDVPLAAKSVVGVLRCRLAPARHAVSIAARRLHRRGRTWHGCARPACQLGPECRYVALQGCHAGPAGSSLFPGREGNDRQLIEVPSMLIGCGLVRASQAQPWPSPETGCRAGSRGQGLFAAANLRCQRGHLGPQNSTPAMRQGEDHAE